MTRLHTQPLNNLQDIHITLYTVSQKNGTIFLTPTKEEVHVFARVCLSVCLLARLLKNTCMDSDEMLRVDRCRDTDERINF